MSVLPGLQTLRGMYKSGFSVFAPKKRDAYGLLMGPGCPDEA